MAMKALYLLLLLLATSVAFAQSRFTIRGIVVDTAGQPLAGATIRVQQHKDSATAITSASGAFSVASFSQQNFTLTATYSGLQPFVQAYAKTTASAVFQVEPIVLLPNAATLDDIVIRSVRPMIIREDTVQFNADAYKVREGAPVEDVIKKLPGVTVDKDGNIETGGKKVTRVRVNGKDFFGGDLQTATQNIPAELIQNIQIIDDYGDQANLTGIRNGEPEKIININTQPNRNRGTFGNATAAAGNEGRYAGNLFVNNFKDDRQLSFLGAVNNTNANLFNFNGGGRGGGARGANFGSENRGGGGGAGITLSRSAGINFRNKWGKNISVYGSYSFSSRSTTLASTVFSQDINPDLMRTTQRVSNSTNSSANHRLTWNMEYNIDSQNFIKVSPYLSYSSSENQSRGTSEIRAESESRKYYTFNNNFSFGNSNSPNGGGSVLYNHKFARRGRNFSTNLTLDRSGNDADRFVNNLYRNIDSSTTPVFARDTFQMQAIETIARNTRTNVRVSYIEPLNATASTVLELSYDWNKSATQSIREVQDLPDSLTKTGVLNETQSNHFRYNFITNKAAISLKGRKEKYNYSIGLQSQPNRLSGNTVGKNQTISYQNLNWIPSARFVYNFARSNTLTATLDGSAREPGFMQLQPIADSSNLNNIVVGNPNLKNELTNRLSIQYNKFDQKKGSSIFANFSYDKTNDKIVSSRTNTRTQRTTSYLNTDGFFGYNGNASFTQPFANRKFVAGLSMAANFDNNISFTNGQRNKGKNWNIRPGANLRLDLENKVDVTVRADYTTYQTVTHFATYTNTRKAQSLQLGVNGKNFFGDLTVGYDFSKLVNYGFNSSVNSNPSILNVYAEYRMLKAKMLTIRLQGFDLFNENTGINRTVNENTITDSRTIRLARYFLLSANIRLAKFAGASLRGGGPNRQRMGR